MRIARVRTARTATIALTAWLLIAACSTDRTVTSPSERFSCVTSAECAAGFGCLCGYCQPAGGSVQCLTDAGDGVATDTGPADAGSQDAGAADAGGKDAGPADTGAADTGAADAGPTVCNVVTWAGCKTSEGCYWNDTLKHVECLPYGSIAEDGSCDAAKLNACGKGATGAPLLCDSVDLKCYPLCDTQNVTTCTAGETCFTLQDPDKQSWPDNAGICAK